MSKRPPSPVLSLTPERRALLDQWAGQAHASARQASLGTRILPRCQELQPAPLSFAQERLWFLEQLHPGQSLYVIPVTMHLGVRVSTEALQRALDEIVNRHEVLRSRFVTVDGPPHQVVEPGVQCVLRLVDLSDLPESDRVPAARAHLQRETVTPFDLGTTCRMRATLLTLDTTDHVLVTTFHHIAFDGWSTTPFLRELTELYTAFVQQRPSPLPSLAIQYADYATWQRTRLADASERDRLFEYWTPQLAGLRVPEIVPDFGRPSRPTHRAGRHTLTLPSGVVAGLNMLAQREGVTHFMVLLAAVDILIQRYTRRDDVSVGTSVAGRSHADLEPLIGCCLNTLVLRTDLSGDPRVSALLGRVRKIALGALAHQALPFELLLQHLQPARDLARTPLFQVYVNYLSVGEYDPAGRPEGEGTRPVLPGSGSVAPVPGEDTHSPFELALYARPVRDALVLSLVHAHDLFEPATAVLFLRDLAALMAEMVEHPDSRVSTLALSDGARRPRSAQLTLPLPEGWESMTVTECTQSIADLFKAVAARHRHNIAVRTGNTTITYEELAWSSARVGCHVRAISELGDRVGLLLGHDERMLIALLGVLQGGAAYVPFDPGHPFERLATLAASSTPVALLADVTHRPLAEALAARLPSMRVLVLEETLATPEPTQLHQRHVPPDGLAYLLYTSGSTGLPKGVTQSHRNVLGHIRAYVNGLRIRPRDTLSLLATYGFDAAVMDIFGALLRGATLLPISLRTDDVDGLVRKLAHVTVLHATPTVFRHLLALPNVAAAVRGVRAVVLGGEPALQTDVALYRRNFRDECLLVNGLGPTESTLALQYTLDHDTHVDDGAVPVGYPVADTQVNLVNGDRHDVAVLAIGEVAIRSPHVALGYWNDEVLTAQAFRHEGSGREERTFFSGDLAWRDREGCLHFAGRRDGQLKLRGVRIESEEVERRLLECEGVSAAAVAVVTGAHDALVAYVVGSNGVTCDASTIRRQLLIHLPEVMVPAVFVGLDRLPLTVNGKVDRAALPTPSLDNMLKVADAGGRHEPDTPIEHQLAAMWCEVLNVSSVSRFDSFFELGGHSLLATQVVSRIRSTLGRAVPLRACFEAPTLEALARVIEQADVVQQKEIPVPEDVPAARAARDRYKVRLR